MDWTDSLAVHCDTRIRWAQLKQRLWAQGKSRGSSKSSRQIGQVSSDSSVSIFRQNKVGLSAKSRKADQLSVKMTEKRSIHKSKFSSIYDSRGFWLLDTFTNLTLFQSWDFSAFLLSSVIVLNVNCRSGVLSYLRNSPLVLIRQTTSAESLTGNKLMLLWFRPKANWIKQTACSFCLSQIMWAN